MYSAVVFFAFLSCYPQSIPVDIRRMEFSSSARPFICFTVTILVCLHVRGIDLLNQACPIFMSSVTFVESDGLTMLFPLSVHLCCWTSEFHFKKICPM